MIAWLKALWVRLFGYEPFYPYEQAKIVDRHSNITLWIGPVGMLRIVGSHVWVEGRSYSLTEVLVIDVAWP